MNEQHKHAVSEDRSKRGADGAISPATATVGAELNFAVEFFLPVVTGWVSAVGALAVGAQMNALASGVPHQPGIVVTNPYATTAALILLTGAITAFMGMFGPQSSPRLPGVLWRIVAALVTFVPAVALPVAAFYAIEAGQGGERPVPIFGLIGLFGAGVLLHAWLLYRANDARLRRQQESVR